jgi:tetratricopeptide (TPR) repeat protein
VEIPSALALALQYLRSKRGLSWRMLADILSIAEPGLLRRYERGKKQLSREQLEEVLGPIGFGPEEIDIFLFADSLISHEAEDDPSSPVALTREERRRIDKAVLAAARLGADVLRKNLIRRRRLEKARRAREEAARLWDLLKGHSPEDRRALVLAFPEYRQWALAEKIAHESARTAAKDADEAIELAELALFIAERVPGDDRWRSGLQGYVWLFIGNARRVANLLDEADQAFLNARRLLGEGSLGDPEILDGSRLLDLEASLRRDEQRYPEALSLLDQALEASAEKNDEAIARLLLKKEYVLERMGDHEEALGVLEKALSHIERAGSEDLLFVLYFNTADNLCTLERYGEAGGFLEKAETLADKEGKTLSFIRLLWLRAKITAGEGRDDEAESALWEVEREFTDRGLAYDAALSSLDLALILLRQDRTAEVRALALRMAWIFGSKGIRREALASLSLFCEAAKREAATVELTREVISQIDSVRHSAPLPKKRKKSRA